MKISLLLIILIASILPCCSSGSSNDPTTGTPEVKGITLTIQSNPFNVLSAYASWTTDEPMDSEVQFGDGSYEFKIYESR